jgi:ActR/RegA family two-component response regulator
MGDPEKEVTPKPMAELPRLLFVDDDPSVRRGLELRLKGTAAVTGCASAEDALERVRDMRFDAALVDVNLGAGRSGIGLIGALRDLDPDMAAIVFTAHASFDTAMRSIGVHSYDFIPKTLGDDAELVRRIGEAVLRTREARSRRAGESEALRQRTALAEALVAGELRLTDADIQRGLLGESLHQFSTLLGQAELLSHQLGAQAARSAALGEPAASAAALVAELQECVGRLRETLAKPDSACRSVNEALEHAARAAQRAPFPGAPPRPLNLRRLAVDQPIPAEGRALMRAVVILVQFLRRHAPPGAVVSVEARMAPNPGAELARLRGRRGARVLLPPTFAPGGRMAVVVEVAGPLGRTSVERLAELFVRPQPPSSDDSPWSALAMLSRLRGALIMESRPPAGVSYSLVVGV